MKRAPKPIIEICWVDANSTHGWAPPDEVLTSGVSPCFTIGYLLGETKDAVILAGSLDLSDTSAKGAINGVCGSIVIPKKMIVGRKVLRK